MSTWMSREDAEAVELIRWRMAARMYGLLREFLEDVRAGQLGGEWQKNLRTLRAMEVAAERRVTALRAAGIADGDLTEGERKGSGVDG